MRKMIVVVLLLAVSLGFSFILPDDIRYEDMKKGDDITFYAIPMALSDEELSQLSGGLRKIFEKIPVFFGRVNSDDESEFIFIEQNFSPESKEWTKMLVRTVGLERLVEVRAVVYSDVDYYDGFGYFTTIVPVSVKLISP